MKTGIELITEERKRQIEVKGYSSEHDDEHAKGELSEAAASYALSHSWVLEERKAGRSFSICVALIREMIWPFGAVFWRPTPDNRVRELAKSGALIAS